RSAASAGSRAAIDASRSARCGAGSSSASSRWGLRARQRSGSMPDMAVGDRRRHAAHRMVQIEAALLPAALNRPFRYAAHRGDLGEREAAEELQVDDLGEAGLDLRQLVERIADAQQLLGVADAVAVVGQQRGDLEQAAPLL